MRIYLVRHGETKESGEGERHTLHTSLSEKGLSQARSVAKRFSSLKIDLILSSHFKRAEQTAEAIGKATGAEVRFSELLRERKRLEDPDKFKQNDPQFLQLQELLKKNFDNPEFHHDEEETFYEFKKRVQDFIESLNMLDKEHILVVTHTDVIRMVTCLVIFGEILTSQMYSQAKDVLKHKSTGITVIEKNEDKWSFITFNDHAHLT